MGTGFCLDNLKTTLGMNALRCRTPDMVQRRSCWPSLSPTTSYAGSSAKPHDKKLPRPRISFKGTLDTLRQFHIAISQTSNPKQRYVLWHKLLRTIATDLVPLRPDRREPRPPSNVESNTQHLHARATSNGIVHCVISVIRAQNNVLSKRHSPVGAAHRRLG